MNRRSSSDKLNSDIKVCNILNITYFWLKVKGFWKIIWKEFDGMYHCLPFVPKNMFMTGSIFKEQAILEVLKCNDETSQYQLTLSKEDAVLLVDTRRAALKATQRIEIGGGTINKIIAHFKDSPYISNYNYASTISELIDTFYYFKNETLDEVSDDELIEMMKTLFDQRCHGSIELLQGRELERIARGIRFGEDDFADEDEEF